MAHKCLSFKGDKNTLSVSEALDDNTVYIEIADHEDELYGWQQFKIDLDDITSIVDWLNKQKEILGGQNG